MNSGEFTRYLKKHGARFVESGKGGHQHWEKDGRWAVVAIHGKGKELGQGIVRKICKDLGIEPPK